MTRHLMNARRKAGRWRSFPSDIDRSPATVRAYSSALGRSLGEQLCEAMANLSEPPLTVGTHQAHLDVNALSSWAGERTVAVARDFFLMAAALAEISPASEDAKGETMSEFLKNFPISLEGLAWPKWDNDTETSTRAKLVAPMALLSSGHKKGYLSAANFPIDAAERQANLLAALFNAEVVSGVPGAPASLPARLFRQRMADAPVISFQTPPAKLGV